MNLIEILINFSTLPLMSISIISIIGAAILIALEKEIKPFLVLVLLISLALSIYLLSNFLQGFFGFNTGDIERIENHKNIIILFSKIEILSLVLGIVFFSNISLLFNPKTFSKVKSTIIAALGIIIIILNFTSDQFFLKDTLKLNINKYMGKEGPLFDLFTVYFGATILFEVTYLLLIRNRIDPKYSNVYKTVMYGIISIIVFGILELLELYDIIYIYPYSPSLLGIGITLFSFTILIVLIDRYSKTLLLNEKITEIISESNKKIENNVKEIITTTENLTNQIDLINEKIKEILNLPNLTESLINKTNTSFQNMKETVERINQFSTQEIEKTLNTINNLNQKIKEEKTLEKIKKTLKEEKNIESNVRDIPLSLVSKKQLQVFDIVKELTKLSIISEISNLINSILEYLEQSKVQLVNAIILVEKNSQTELSPISILSNEMLNKVKNVRETISNLLIQEQKLTSIQEELNKLINTEKIEKITSRSLLEETKILESIEKLETKNANIENQIKNLGNVLTKITSSIDSIKYNTENMENSTKNLFSIVQELQTIYEQLSSITNTVTELKENIEKFKEDLKAFTLELSI